MFSIYIYDKNRIFLWISTATCKYVILYDYKYHSHCSRLYNWFLHLRLVYGICVEWKLDLPSMTLRTNELLTQHIFLHCRAAKSLLHQLTIVFMYGILYLAIWTPQAEKLCIVMILIDIWLLLEQNGIQRWYNFSICIWCVHYILWIFSFS